MVILAVHCAENTGSVRLKLETEKLVTEKTGIFGRKTSHVMVVDMQRKTTKMTKPVRIPLKKPDGGGLW